MGRGHKQRDSGRIPRLQRLCAPGMRRLLGKAVLLRRMRGERIPCDRADKRDLRKRLPALPQADGVCDMA